MTNRPAKYNNLGYFNLARGIGIMMILLGHSIVPFLTASGSGTGGLFSGAGSVLGGGVMAMFFLISGFGFYTRSPKKCFKTQARLLLYPYFQVAGMLIFARMVLSLVRGRNPLTELLNLLLTLPLCVNAENADALFGAPLKSVTILWFILALFGGWVIYNGICRIRDEKKQNLLLLLCLVASWALTLISKAWPLCLPMALLAACYLAAGFTVKRKNLLVEKLPVKAWVFMGVIITASCAFGAVDIGAGIWKLGLVDVAATFCIGFLLLRAYACFMDLEIHNRVIHLVERIGNQSIWIVFFHAIEKSLFPWYRLKDFIDLPWLCILICFTCRSLMIRTAYRVQKHLTAIYRTHRKKKFTITH